MHFEKEALRYFQSLSLEQHERFYKFIIETLLPRLSSPSDKSATSIDIGAFYDRGLFFKKVDGFHCVSGLSESVLRSYLSRGLKREIKPLDTIQVILLIVHYLLDH